MKLLTSLPTQIRKLMRAKIGRCARCWRSSIVGSLVGWTMLVLVSLFWPNPVAFRLAFLLAASFTLLMVSHLTIFTMRVATALRSRQNGRVLERREFMITLCKVGVAALVGTLFGSARQRIALAQGNSDCAHFCNEIFPPGPARGKCKSDAAHGRGICFEGPCLPVAADHKPKTDPQVKLTALLQNNTVPSALAGAFFQMARRFLLDRSPDNSLEASAFSVFRHLSSLGLQLVACSLRRFDSLSPSDRERLFGPAFAGAGDQAVTPELLASLVAEELLHRASLMTYGDANGASEERPGRARPRKVIVTGGEITVFTPTICKVFPPTTEKPDGFRTNTFVRPFVPGPSYIPQLTLAEFQQGKELQERCSLDLSGMLDCQIQTAKPLMPCPGNTVEGVCLRVPEVRPGHVVKLEGFNFFNVDARVRLAGEASGLTREVEAHVWGDITTPITETIAGVERVVLDCRVKDLITFKVPDDLPDDIYGIQVIVPNDTGIGAIPEFRSEGQQFIQVLPPLTTTFQIASETLDCPNETDSGIPFFPDAGSDEVGIRIITTPVNIDPISGETTLGAASVQKFRFDDVDTGDKNIDMNRVLFKKDNIAGVTLAIIGFEVDSEAAFEAGITEWTDAFIQIVTSAWNSIIELLGTVAAGVIVTLFELTPAGLLTSAIAILFTAAVDFFVSLWAPADLLIEDFKGFTEIDLAALTNPKFPKPPVVTFTSPGNIDVTIEPLSKDVQYRERRDYVSDDQGSRYQITLRYNRF